MKGREMWVQMKLAPMAAQKLECAIGTCDNWTIGPRRLVRTFDLAPLQGASLLVDNSQGWKPWAEFCSSCGAKDKSLSPRIVACSTL
jgi:hypothetical protein